MLADTVFILLPEFFKLLHVTELGVIELLVLLVSLLEIFVRI
jgi:hypothetical protein